MHLGGAIDAGGPANKAGALMQLARPHGPANGLAVEHPGFNGRAGLRASGTVRPRFAQFRHRGEPSRCRSLPVVLRKGLNALGAQVDGRWQALWRPMFTTVGPSSEFLS